MGLRDSRCDENDGVGLWIPVATRMTGWGSGIPVAARIKATNEKALGQVTIRLNSAMAMLLSTGELRGIATAVARAVTACGFETLGLIRIDVLVRTDKAASARVLEKVRYQREGLFRRSVLQDGAPVDHLLYAALIEE